MESYADRIDRIYDMLRDDKLLAKEATMKVYESTSYNAVTPETFAWTKVKDIPMSVLAECFVKEVYRNMKDRVRRDAWRDALGYLAGVANIPDEPLLGTCGATQVPGRKAESEAGRA